MKTEELRIERATIVRTLAFSPDEVYLASGGSEGNVMPGMFASPSCVRLTA